MISILQILIESEASEKAKKLGLKSIGFGRYVNPKTDKVVANSENGKLVKFVPTDKDDLSKQTPSDSSEIAKLATYLSSGKYRKLSRDSQGKIFNKIESQSKGSKISLQSMLPKLSSKSADAIAEYVSYGSDTFKDINSSLRYSNYDTQDNTKEHVQSLIHAMDDAFKENRTDKDFTVFRGIKNNELLDSITPNSTLLEKGFSSTSVNPFSAYRFMRNGFMMKIRVPKGYPAVSANPAEGELLLQRNTKFKVKNVDKKNRMVEVDVLD